MECYEPSFHSVHNYRPAPGLYDIVLAEQSPGVRLGYDVDITPYLCLASGPNQADGQAKNAVELLEQVVAVRQEVKLSIKLSLSIILISVAKDISARYFILT